MDESKLRIIPLGGLGEIGRNMMAIEYLDDIVVIDAGLMFPEEEMLGIDLVIPDITYLLENRDRVRGIVITHGHEDHIGALPYVLNQLQTPVYSTRLTHGLISVRLKEHGLLDAAQLHIVDPGGQFYLGRLRIELIRVSHSIPDAVGIAIHTPLGVLIHTGDFKLDHTPVDQRPTDLIRLAQLGAQGVLLLMSDSTYAEFPGYTPSERALDAPFRQVMAESPGRVIVACFASLISRMQQVIDASVNNNRKVYIAGRSMVDNAQMAAELGYLDVPSGVLLNTNEMRRISPEKLTIMATGSQGEPTAVLARLANGDHRQLKVIRGDTVLLSASPIPGNEVLVSRTIDNLFRQGANVLYSTLAQVHVHGHASQEELKLMIGLVKPKYFVPIHGEYRHLVLHTRLAQSLGIPPENTFVMVDGDVLEIDSSGARVTDKVSASYVYVDGLGVGDIDHLVLRDRRALARDGMLVIVLTIDEQSGKLVGLPDIVSRGFLDPVEWEGILERSKEIVARSLSRSSGNLTDTGYVNSRVKEILSNYLYEQTKRRPMILPISVKV